MPSRQSFTHSFMQPLISVLKPRKAINKAFLKVKPNSTEIEPFKTNQLVYQLYDLTPEENAIVENAVK